MAAARDPMEMAIDSVRVVDDKVDQAVVKAITGIAHSVGKLTVAEFVDRPQILPLLREDGQPVEYGQVLIRVDPNG